MVRTRLVLTCCSMHNVWGSMVILSGKIGVEKPIGCPAVSIRTAPLDTIVLHDIYTGNCMLRNRLWESALHFPGVHAEYRGNHPAESHALSPNEGFPVQKASCPDHHRYEPLGDTDVEGYLKWHQDIAATGGPALPALVPTLWGAGSCRGAAEVARLAAFCCRALG